MSEEKAHIEEQPGFFQEFWLFLKERKIWWMAPIVIFLLLLSALIVLTEGSAAAPFIYTLF